MILELAIGDAYGAGFEYADGMVGKFNDLSGYIQHPRHGTPPGCYTDDTQMSIAIAEVILSGEPWKAINLANSFVRAFKRDPREGYARGFHAFLQEVGDGDEFLSKIRPDSDKSGAAMRAAPLGVLATAEEVLAKNIIQAKVTHDTPDGIAAANAAALMTHFCLYELGSLDGLGDYLNKHVPGYNWSKDWGGKVGSTGLASVSAALTALRRNRTLSTLLTDCISFRGDVDTVATIALAAASCSKEYVLDLPQQLYDNLEAGPYGRRYLEDLDRRLLRMKR